MKLRTIKEAAAAVDVHETTIWRWLRLGLVKRFKSQPGAPRATFVDLEEVRALKIRPPVHHA